ncbi:BRCA1-associated RING domain protein 1 [Gouania willdenowi]|uniref:BRCA1-associated RING domain protein 1 n=1 Tax=Gouania willdenowi TaxID=441366 RepID=UPI00105490D1|nr:BRCA1-associated RING domain protein 1 [Gouania willdenowi]
MEEPGSSLQTNYWSRTKEAVANFRRLLLCSKCSNLMKEPVCLGTCEHMLCRSCAGPRAGDGCVVCHSPAWVKDIQMNRQLSSIIQLFSGLESLFNPEEQSDSPPVAEIQVGPRSPVFTQKKNFKIWFSPRSRKVRCTLEKPPDVGEPDGRSSEETPAAKSHTCNAKQQDLSVFNFISSSQDCGSPTPPKRNGKGAKKKNKKVVPINPTSATTQNYSKEKKSKKRLEAINKEWGITEEVQTTPAKAQTKRSSKRVSFLSPAVKSDKPLHEAPPKSPNELSPSENAARETVPQSVVTVLNTQTSPSRSVSHSVAQHDKVSTNDSPQEQDKSPSELSNKRSREEERDLESTPKRPRASPGWGRKCLISRSRVVLNSPPSTGPGSTQGASPSTSLPVSADIHKTSPLSPRASTRRLSTGSPAFMKRNHKGETPLHLAAIKGDVEAVCDLLEQGVDPNLKDHAGWTPLHEACNLGHLAVVKVLVSSGALLNTPGYENDSPLHDAVRNGHWAVAKLLLELGASQSVLNLYGKRPVDYAASLEMLEIFQGANEGTHSSDASPILPTSLSVMSECARKDLTALFLASKLSQPEQQQLAKLGALLGAKVADAYSGSVSHVVVPDGEPLPTTNSTLLGLLAGCWVVRYKWVEACLQEGGWVPEAEHEAGEGPQRSRINRCSLLPQLFDGCFFFLLGSFKTPTKDKLIKLLLTGGGHLLSRQPKPDSDVTQTLSAAAYHAAPGSDQALCTQYIIYDPQGPHRPKVVRRGKVWSAPSTWLINCMAAFCLFPVPEAKVV